MRFFDKSEACISFVEPGILIHAICRAHSTLVTREVRGPKTVTGRPLNTPGSGPPHRGPGVNVHLPPVSLWSLISPSTISSLDAFPSLYGQELTPGVVINTLL